MTLVSQIITDAYRIGNILAIGQEPTDLQKAEALRYLQRIVKSTIGYEAGEELEPVAVQGAGIDRPKGFPFFDLVSLQDWFVPENVRLMLNLVKPITVYLHPQPDDGARFAVNDVKGNLATYNVVVKGNGRLVEGQSEVTLSTNSQIKEWFYREDLGNWQVALPLVAANELPFPEEFDDYFVTMLAMRLNPSYNAGLDSQGQSFLNRTQQMLRARYRQVKEVSPDSAFNLKRRGGVNNTSRSLFDQGIDSFSWL